MFTGIIEEVGIVSDIKHGKTSSVIVIQAKEIFSDLKLGDSVAVNGVCLTVTAYEKSVFHADIMNETLKRTSLGALSNGSLVNLERAMTLNGRFGGHIVTGHIDGTGTLSSIKKDGIASILTLAATNEIINGIVEKGSVALDGISLTVCGVDRKHLCFQVSIIPHTKEKTTLLQKKPGAIINIENDVIGKYVQNFLTLKPADDNKTSVITKEYLLEHGF